MITTQARWREWDVLVLITEGQVSVLFAGHEGWREGLKPSLQDFAREAGVPLPTGAGGLRWEWWPEADRWPWPRSHALAERVQWAVLGG